MLEKVCHSKIDMVSLSQIWQDAKKKVKSHSPELFQHLNAIFKTNTSLEIHTAKYRYGETILDRGILNNTRSFAFGLVLDGGLELFTEREDEPDKIATLAMLKPGNILLLNEDLGTSIYPLNIQNMTAGARSIFLLPKIGNSDHFWRMARRNNIPLDIPSSLFQQWEVFRALVASKNSTWHVELLLFTEDWLNQENSQGLCQYLKKQRIPHIPHNQALDETVDRLIEERAEVYSGQILKNVLAIANGDLPGFILAEDETFAPIKLIQQAFIEDYGLKAAELIHPDYIHPGSECFYSFELHQAFDPRVSFSKKSHQPSVNVIEETQKLYFRLLEDTENHNSYPADTYLHAKLEFFHAFANNQTSHTPQPKDKMSPYAPFIRKGCIAISPDTWNSHVTH